MEVPSSSSSAESVQEMLSQLELTEREESLFLSPDTASTASTQSDDQSSSTQDMAMQHLNAFLISSGINPIVRSWQTWGSSFSFVLY